MNKRIILFNSPWIKGKQDVVEEENIHLRIGIATIAAYLRGKGIDVAVIDSDDKSQIDKLKAFSPQFVGIPAYTFEIYDTARTAEIVKAVLPQSQLIVGGPHPSALPRETLEEFPIFDFVVMGEGEETLKEIVEDKKEIEEIEGIAYRRNRTIKVNPRRKPIQPLDILSISAWDLYDLERYKINWHRSRSRLKFKSKDDILYIPIESMRGCPYDCIFCFRINDRSVRFKSPSRVIDEMRRVISQFGVNRFYFVDPTFGINKRLALELCNEIIKYELNTKITWEVSSRVDVVDEELLIKMKEAGCDTIGFGVESGDDEILKKSGKNISCQKIIDTIKLCNKVGMTVGTSFILGHPFETKETLKKTIKFAKKLPIATTNFAIMVPFPGTEVRQMAKNRIGGLRILTDKWDVYGKQIGMTMDLEQIPRRDLIYYQTRAYLEFYLFPCRWRYFFYHLTLERLIYSLKRMFNLIIK